MKLEIFLLFTIMILNIHCDSVCDERLLRMELLQDIEDNGVLDCLRVIQPPHSYQETIDEKNKRIAAQWDTDCAFEAEYDWMKTLRDVHGISNLVDDTGDIVERDFDDQADMCEIIRAAIFAGKFKSVTTDLVNIPPKFLDLIDCPGAPQQSEICAVTGASYFQKDTWFILLEGLAINVDGKPNFVKAPTDSSEMPEIPEVEGQILKTLEKSIVNNPNKPVTNIKSQLNQDTKNVAASLKKVKELLGDSGEKKEAEKKIDEVPEDQKTKIVQAEINSCTEYKKGNDWNAMQEMELKLNEPKEKVVLAFGNINGVLGEKASFQCRLLQDGTEIKISRKLIGDFSSFSSSTAFVKKLTKSHKINMEYISNLKGSAKKQNCPKTVETDSRHIGAILFDGSTSISSVLPQNELSFDDTKGKWVTFDGLKLSVPISEDCTGLFFYNLAFSTDEPSKFGTRLVLDSNPLKHSLFLGGSKPNISPFGWGISKLSSQTHTIQLAYTTESSFKFNPKSNDAFTAGLSYIKLPTNTIFHEKNAAGINKMEIGSWNQFSDLKIDLKITGSKNLFVFYQVTMPIGGAKTLYTRLMLNGKEITGGRSSSNNGNLAALVSQAAITVHEGSSKISLEYKAEDAWTLGTSDTQGASLVVAEFNAE